MPLYQGVPRCPPGVVPPILQSGDVPHPGNANPQTAALPTNYKTSLPAYRRRGPERSRILLGLPAAPGQSVRSGQRRPTPWSWSTPSASPTSTAPRARGRRTELDGPAMPARTGTALTGNYVYSVQRFQPYRGGHAVPVAPPSTWVPPPASLRRPRSRSIRATATPSRSWRRRTNSQLLDTQGIYYNDRRARHYPATPFDLPHLGWANEYEQGSNSTAGRALGLLPVQRPRFHQRGRADAGARLLARALHQAIRRVRPVVCQRLEHLRRGHSAVTPIIPPAATVPTYPRHRTRRRRSERRRSPRRRPSDRGQQPITVQQPGRRRPRRRSTSPAVHHGLDAVRVRYQRRRTRRAARFSPTPTRT